MPGLDQRGRVVIDMLNNFRGQSFDLFKKPSG